jgi:hypothetical protein
MSNGVKKAVGGMLGGTESSGKTKSEFDQTTTTTPYQSGYLTDLFGQAQNQYNAGIPDISQSQALGADAVAQYQSLLGQNIGGQTLNAGAGAVQTLADPNILNPASNPALQAYMQQAAANTARGFQQGVSTNIEAPASIYNQVGSSRHGVAQGIAGQGLADALALQQSQLAATGYGQGLSALGQGAALAPGVAQQQQQSALFDPLAATQASGIQYGLDTAQNTLERQSLIDYANLIKGNYGGTTTASGTSKGEGPGHQSGGLVGALGGAAGGGAIASALPASAAGAAPWVVGAGALLGALG